MPYLLCLGMRLYATTSIAWQTEISSLRGNHDSGDTSSKCSDTILSLELSAPPSEVRVASCGQVQAFGYMHARLGLLLLAADTAGIKLINNSPIEIHVMSVILYRSSVALSFHEMMG